MSKYRIVESVGGLTQPIHSYEDIEIHHPSANRRGLQTGREQDFERNPRTGELRPHAQVEGEWEEIRRTSDGRVLVKKDMIFSQDIPGAVHVPCPVEGYLRYNKNYGTAEIYDGSGPDAKLLGKVLHMKPETFRHLDGKHVSYGQPLGVQWEAGAGGLAHAKDGIGVHAHIELEPAQFRRYISDIEKGVITPTSFPAKSVVETKSAQMTHGESTSREAPSSRTQSHPDGSVVKLHSHGEKVEALQRSLSALGYMGADGKPLSADGDFGRNTEHAVRAFQQAHGLEVDGKAGSLTSKALAEAQQRPLISEATHPNHGLYAEIAKHVPTGTRPEAIANVAMQVQENGMSGREQISRMAVQGSDVFVMGQMPGLRVRVDLEAPTASLQQTSDHMREQSRHAETALAQPALQAGMVQ